MRRRPLVALACCGALLAGCSGDAPATSPPAGSGSPSAAGTPSGSPSTSPTESASRGPAHRAYDAALSEPVEDSVYPGIGDPGVDALHYDLDLAWDPGARRLTGTERLTFRSTRQAAGFRLDLAPELEVSRVLVDGERAGHRHRGDDLVVRAGVQKDGRHVVRIEYAGSPRPTAAPTTRSDVPGLGWTTTPEGAVWTMQEPFGAHTWYAVNDQPSDKALYDFTLSVPRPMVGVANGQLESRSTRNVRTVTEWSLDEPAASYLVTVAMGDYESVELRSASGVPVSIWVPTDRTDLLPDLRRTTVAALDWAEERLGPYPFDSLGFLFVDSLSGMETQTMITLGMTDYTTSPPVLVHEVVHQWWGNLVTPRDWRDLWMNEGMTTYLQVVWESEHGGTPLETTLAGWSAQAQQMRDLAGPPGDYDKRSFAEANVYVLPALMWHEVRRQIGDATFWRLVRQWPRSDEDGSADRREIMAWWEAESGVELSRVFRSHLFDAQQP